MPEHLPPTVLHLTGDRRDSGGILSVIRAVQEASSVQGFKHVLLVNNSFEQTRTPVLSTLSLPDFVGEGDSQWKFLVGALRSLPKLRRLVCAHHFDVFHAHTRGGYLLGLFYSVLYRRPQILFTNHTYGNNRWLYRLALRSKRMHSVALTPNMLRHYHMTEQHPRVSTVSECCRKSFLELPLRPLRPQRVGPFQFVGVGNLALWKKWDVLIEAFGLLPVPLRSQLQFRHYGHVGGDPGSRGIMPRLEKRIRELGLEQVVTFCGPSNTIPKIVSQADWFVLPSTNEPCSVALLEALALGRPVIVSSSGGNVDIVQEGVNGVFFEPDDAASLAGVLERVITGQVAIEDAQTIRDSVAKRCASVVCRRYEGLYRALMTDAKS